MKRSIKIIIEIIILILLILFGYWIYENGRIINYVERDARGNNQSMCSYDTETGLCTPESNCKITVIDNVTYCGSK